MIAIVDYGLGNIKAFHNVYKRLDIECFFASDKSALEKATKIVLPGVGAFDHAMDRLNQSGLRETLDNLVLQHNIPVLGICVGMQMMANRSDEGRLEGLGWIPGEVRQFQVEEDQRENLPLPHMGWNSLSIKGEIPLVSGFENSPRFYFLHSYYFQCAADSVSLATTRYACEFSSVVSKENAFGIQCHPEKSHHNGVKLLKNFAMM